MKCLEAEVQKIQNSEPCLYANPIRKKETRTRIVKTAKSCDANERPDKNLKRL